MFYRDLGKVKAHTSLLGFGCMRLPKKEDGKIDRNETFKLLDTAYDRGVNYYDTAYPYHAGESELVVGEWLKTKDRSSIYLATKLPMMRVTKEEQVASFFHEQLEKLQTDYFDFYLVHALNAKSYQTMKELGVYEKLNEYKKQGKIKRLGFSFHDSFEVFKDIITSYDWDFCQIQYNYFDTDYQAGDKGYELAKSLGIPMTIMEPIRGGLLAKVPRDVRTIFDEVHPEYSDASFALRWVADHENVACVLSGMSSYDQVMDNLTTFDTLVPFTEKDYTTYKKAKLIFDERQRVKCTGCRYCMPCPFGVNIPDVFKRYNEESLFDINNKERYLGMSDEAKASNCRNCRACVS
ncbi:MAG: aldo/keto reductase, partial [Erysipelotrichaceae bacterium]|nr:aldo/keto reductase [Erysipelotrichaceae bacterium]